MMPVALRLAWRELRGGVRGFRIFLASLALGVAAIAGAGSLVTASRAGIVAEGRVLLGGDLEARVSHLGLDPAPQQALAEAGRVSQTLEMRAMAYTADARRNRVLVELKAVDGAYPLYGQVALDPPRPLAEALARRGDAFGAAGDAALLSRLGLAVGDRIKVGEAKLQIRAVIAREPDRITNLFAFGPRLLVSLEAASASGLIRPGSLVRHVTRVAVPAGEDGEALKDRLGAAFPDAPWQLRIPAEAAPGMQGFFASIGTYLTLVGLAALLIGGIGVAGAVKAHLEGRLHTIAVLKCLGAAGGTVFRTYLTQLAAMTTVGVALGLAIGAAVPALAAGVLGDTLPVPPRLGLYPGPLLLAAWFGILTAAAFALWPLARARDIPPTALLRGPIAQPARRLPRWPHLAAIAAAAVGLAALALLAADNRMLTGWFIVATALAFALFALAGALVRALARRASRRRRGRPGWVAVRLALAGLHRPGAPTVRVVLSLGLGLTVLTAVMLVQANLDRELGGRMPAEAPAFFFIDIAPDEAQDFRASIAAVPGAAIAEMQAMVRGRIIRLNGAPVDPERVQSGAQWAVRGDRGLAMAAEPPPGARIVAGHWWPAGYQGPPLVSVAADVARGLGLGLGDTLAVNVLGRDIEATVANLRDVTWASLAMNFALMFSPGTLDGAPYGIIATVTAPPSAEDAVERTVTDRLPAATAIRVRQGLEAARALVGRAGAAVRVAALVSLLAGALVLAGTVAAGAERRVREAVILKVLGAARGDVARAVLAEYAILGGATAFLAVGLGAVAAWAVLRLAMDLPFTFLPGTAATTATASLALVLAGGLAGTWRALGAKAARWLRNE